MLRTLLVDTCGSPPQVSVDLFGLAHQIRHVLFGRLNQPRQLTHLSGKFISKFPLLLITPGLFQLIHLGRKPGGTLFHFFGKAMEVPGELP